MTRGVILGGQNDFEETGRNKRREKKRVKGGI